MNTSACFSHNKKKICSESPCKMVIEKLHPKVYGMCSGPCMPAEFSEFNFFYSHVCPLGNREKSILQFVFQCSTFFSKIKHLFLFHLQTVSKITVFSCESFTSWSAILVVTLQKSSIAEMCLLMEHIPLMAL